MKKLELSLAAIFVIGRIFNIWQLPGYMILTFFPTFSLCLLYFFFSFYLLNGKTWKDIFKKETYSKIETFPAVMSILVGSIALAGFVSATMQTAMYYTANHFVFFVSAIILLLAFLGLLVSFLKDNHKQFSKQNLIRIGIALFLGIVSVAML